MNLYVTDQLGAGGFGFGQVLKVYNNVLLLDFIKMAIAMPADQRAQMEAASGEPYTIDGAALGNATAPGPEVGYQG